MLKIQLWITGINYILQYIHTEDGCVKFTNITNSVVFFDQINAALVSRRDFYLSLGYQPSMSLSSIYPRTSATPSSCLGQVPPWTRSQAGSARAVQRAVMESAPGSADAKLRSGCLGRAVPPLLLRFPGAAVPGGAYMLLKPLIKIIQLKYTGARVNRSGVWPPPGTTDENKYNQNHVTVICSKTWD